MSQQTKRSAAEAFGKDHTASAVSKKRTRRRIKQKDSNRPIALPNAIEQESALPPKAAAIVPNGRSSQPASNLDEQTQDAPGANEGRECSRHIRNLKNNSINSENKSLAKPPSIETNNRHDSVKKRSAKDKTRAKKSRVNWRKDGSQSYPKGGWTDLIVGGSFLDADPVLSQDEQYFLLPTKSHVHVYSATTSLLVQSLFISQADPVTSCITCPSDPEQVLVSTYRGTITKYNWATGRKLQKWKIKSGLLRIYGLSASSSTDNESNILAINQNPGGERDILYFSLPVSPDLPVKEVVLRSKQRMASTIVTLESGKLLVGFGGDKVMLGFSQDLDSGECTWRDVNMPGMVVSVDARGQATSLDTTKIRSSVDVVVGLQDGAIIILDDILTWLTQEKGVKGIDRISRRLHWHRGAASAVKWSRDGNYLISGGQETVLVIWQLDTNQQQFLPHLSASICNIVVSSSGSSYTLRLADNSVMMLSTNDLVPKANIRGISVSKELGRTAVATLNPHQSDQILLATPSELSLGSPSALTTLQTINFATSHEVSRQALVRNLTTTVNVDSNGQRVLGPDVVHLKVSHDGLWLAAVDEWTPPDTDRKPLDLDMYDSMSAYKTDIFLKFWSFKNETNMWEMNTKVEGPHSATPHSILQLANNPVRAEFASVGKDRYLRIWRPMLRQRNGLPVKNKADESLYTWICVHERQPDPMPAELESTVQAESAALAYSEDGSTIAVSFFFKERPRGLHFFNNLTLSVDLSYSHVDLCPPGNAEMAFSGKHLLILADKFIIWDVVDEELDCCITLKEDFVQSNRRLLAANVFDRTYAVALNPPDVRKPATVAIFDANQPGTVIHGFEINGHVKALLAATTGPGYIVVDGEARIRRLRPDSSAMKVLKPSAGEQDVMKTLNDVFGANLMRDGEDTMRGLSNVFGANTKSDGEDALPTVVRSDGRPNKTLENILEENATSSKPALPSELFERVARLYMKDNK